MTVGDPLRVPRDKLLLHKKSTEAEPRYYHHDGSGNVRLLTYYTTSLQTADKYRYKPFGEKVVLASGGAVHQFAQQKADGPTGLYHMGARYYDPAIGRFRARDPIGPGYAYGANNPLSFTDPTWLAPQYDLRRKGDGFIRVNPSNEVQVALSEAWDAIPERVRSAIEIGLAIAAVATLPVSAPLLALAIAAAVGVTVGLVTYAITKDPVATLTMGLTAFAIAMPGAAKVAGWMTGTRAVRGAAYVGDDLARVSGVEKATRQPKLAALADDLQGD